MKRCVFVWDIVLPAGRRTSLRTPLQCHPRVEASRFGALREAFRSDIKIAVVNRLGASVVQVAFRKAGKRETLRKLANRDRTEVKILLFKRGAFI